MKDLSVILCTYNRASILVGALDALAAQRVAPTTTWELVVVDNNSNDGTAELVKEFQARAPIPVSYLFERRQGKSFAMNTGMSAASANVLAFTDDDCRPETGWVQSILDCMAQHAAHGLGGRIMPLWSGPRPSWFREDRHIMDSLALLQDGNVRQVEFDGPWERANGIRIWGANMAFRRETFERVGGFDQVLGPRGRKSSLTEDVEFVRRVVGAGFRVFFDPTPTVHHRIGPDRLRKGFFFRHSFSYGEGTALKLGPPISRHLFGVSPHHITGLMAHASAWIAALARRDTKAFEAARQVLEDIGFMYGSVKVSLKAGAWAKVRRGITATGGNK